MRRYLKTSRLIALPLEYQIEQAKDIEESDESEAENHLTNLKLKLAPVRRYLKTSRLLALPLDYQVGQTETQKYQLITLMSESKMS